MSEFDIDNILDSALDEFDRKEEEQRTAAPLTAATIPSTTATAQSANVSTAASPAANPASSSSNSSPSTPGAQPGLAALLASLSSPSAAATSDDLRFEEFSRAFAALGSDAGAGDNDALQQLTTLAAMLEKAAKDTGSPATTHSGTGTGAQPAATPPAANDFDSSINAAIRMVSEGASSRPAQSSAAASLPSMPAGEMDEFLTKMLSEMSASGEDPDAVIERLMSQMLGREYLHQPMIEIAQSYGPWINERRSRLTAEEIANYEGQHRCFQRIVAVYEEKRPAGDEAKAVMELMNDMQAFGQPPPELVSDLLPPEAMAMATGGSGGAPPPLDDAAMAELSKNGCPTQ